MNEQGVGGLDSHRGMKKLAARKANYTSKGCPTDVNFDVLISSHAALT